jgi:hypothetical protein
MKTINNFNGCPEGKCMLCDLYPNSDAGLACDDKCYFAKGEDGEHGLKNFITKHPEQWEKINNETI